MSGQIKGNAQTLLSSGKIGAVKLVGFLSSAGEQTRSSASVGETLFQLGWAVVPEASILSNCPRAIGIHGCVRAAGERKLAREFIKRALDIRLRVERLHIETLPERVRMI